MGIKKSIVTFAMGYTIGTLIVNVTFGMSIAINVATIVFLGVAAVVWITQGEIIE
jgi:putative Mn2+ efflux pump MntP